MTSQTTNFKIISTLGPASLSSEFFTTAAASGQTHFRMNTSHLNIEQIAEYHLLTSQNIPNMAIDYYLDLPGKKLRIGTLAKDYSLKRGDMINIVRGEKTGYPEIGVSHEVFFRQVAAHDIILLQDAQIQLKVVEIKADIIKTEVIQGGKLRSHAGIIINNKFEALREYLPEQRAYLKIAKRLKIDKLALSFISNKFDIDQLRQSCTQISYSPAIIAKIEHPHALDNLESICTQADEIWYCRGDLGSFITPRELMEWQNRTIQTAKNLNKTILIAGQVFQYLTDHPSPTRSEVVHFFQMIEQGVHGIVLSDETAIGINSSQALKAVSSLLDYSK